MDDKQSGWFNSGYPWKVFSLQAGKKPYNKRVDTAGFRLNRTSPKNVVSTVFRERNRICRVCVQVSAHCKTGVFQVKIQAFYGWTFLAIRRYPDQVALTIFAANNRLRWFSCQFFSGVVLFKRHQHGLSRLFWVICSGGWVPLFALSRNECSSGDYLSERGDTKPHKKGYGDSHETCYQSQS